MPRHLILHIGYYKTGSTALQESLAQSRDALAEQGYLYPSSGSPTAGFPNHSGLAFQLLHEVNAHLPRWYRQSEGFKKFEAGERNAFEELRNEILGSPAETVILSSEEFIRFGQEPAISAERVRDVLGELRFDRVSIVAYLRRPDHYLESWYNQLVKMSTPIARLSDSVEHYFHTAHTDFARMLHFWSDKVGCDEMILRDYEKRKDRSAVVDFSEVLGVSDDAISAASGAPNPRINNNFIEYARVQALFRGEGRNGRLLNLLSDMEHEPRLPPLKRVYVLDRQAREKLFNYSRSVNKHLGKLSGTRGGFFQDLDQMQSLESGSISDVEAFRFWAPYISAALQARPLPKPLPRPPRPAKPPEQPKTDG